MKTERTMKYLQNRLQYLQQLVLENEEKRDVLNIEKEELFTQIEEYKNKIDEAYDVFSPKSTKNDFIKEQINLFEIKLNQINDNIEELHEQIESGREEAEEIEKVIEELKSKIDETDEIISILNEIEKEREREINCIDITKEYKFGDYDNGEEYESYEEYDNYNGYQRYDNYEEYNPLVCKKIEVEKKKIRDIIYKCENCSTFMELDVNRCKLELDNIIGLLGDLLKYPSRKVEENEEV